MGKGDDPNCTATAVAAAAVSAPAAALAGQLTAMNPMLTSQRAGRLAAELDATFRRSCLHGQNVLFLHVGGSFSYGLAHADSDLDIRGAYLADSRDFLGLGGPREQLEDRAHDLIVFEAGKLLRLVLKASPNTIETLYSPQLAVTDTGRHLFSIRDRLLSQRARGTYRGFAFSSMKKIESETRPDKHAKAVRHLFRLMEQGVHLLRTGEVQVQVTDPERVMAYGDRTQQQIAREFARLDEQLLTTGSVLPERPDEDAVNDFLVRLREQQLTGGFKHRA